MNSDSGGRLEFGTKWKTSAKVNYNLSFIEILDITLGAIPISPKKKKNFSDFHECAHSIFSLIISYIRTYLVLADHTLGESLNLAYCPSCGFKT